MDDPAAPSPPGSHSRPGDLSDDPARASDSLSLRACSGHRKSNRWRILQGVFPQPVNSQNAFAHTLMGVLRRQQSRFDDSLTELRVALAMRPDFPPTLANLGITLAFVGLPDAAIPLFERSLRLSPYDYYASASHAFLGLCYLLLGNVEAAVASLRTARASNPHLYFAHWWLAAALGLKGELDAAREAFRQAIEIRPDVIAHVGARLRRGTPGHLALYEKTVYLGLRRAGLPDIWAGSNERPAGWVGSYDAKIPLPVPYF